MIDDRDVAAYREQGFLVVPDVLDAAELAAARAEVARILEGARGLAAHTDVYDLEPDHRPDAPRVRRIKTPHRHTPFFRELAGRPKLVAILQRLLGTGAVRLHGSKINMKAAHGGAPVEWHQDWAFYPHTNDDLLAVGVMLDDCTEANGAMLVLPGTHTGPVYDHHADGHFCGAMDPAGVDLDFSRARVLHRPRRVDELPSRARRARLGAEPLGRVARAAALRVRRRRRLAADGGARPRRVRRAAGQRRSPRSRRGWSGCRCACRCRRRRTRARSTRTRPRPRAAISAARRPDGRGSREGLAADGETD